MREKNTYNHDYSTFHFVYLLLVTVSSHNNNTHKHTQLHQQYNDEWHAWEKYLIVARATDLKRKKHIAIVINKFIWKETCNLLTQKCEQFAVHALALDIEQKSLRNIPRIQTCEQCGQASHSKLSFFSISSERKNSIVVSAVSQFQAVCVCVEGYHLISCVRYCLQINKHHVASE